MSNSIQARIDQQLQQLEPKTPEYRYTPEPTKPPPFDQNVTDLLGMNLQDLHIKPLDLSSLTQSLNWNNSTMMGTGTNTYGNYTTTHTTMPPFSSTMNTTSAPSLNITHGLSGPSISVPEGGDIMIGNRSVGASLAAIEARLAILVPDPKKLERYQALKQAYEHYKTLEALCSEESKTGIT